MKRIIFIFLLTVLYNACSPLRHATAIHLPSWMKGKFTDDYGIPYNINDTLFTLGSSARYHILEWNEADQYLLVKNDEANPSEKGLYSRIDYMPFTGMAPYTWGFCLIAYDAADETAAKNAAPADRANPKKGCNGFPFSRMKKAE